MTSTDNQQSTTPATDNLDIRPPQEFNWVYRFFCWCAGVNLHVLRRYPTEYNKFFGVGTAVFMTGFFALLSCGYALTEVFHDRTTGWVNYWIVGFVSLAWAAFIFFLDRFLVSSINKRGSAWRQFFIALPRMLLALLIAVVIARPLELRIFQEEINEQLASEKGQMIIVQDSLFDMHTREEMALRQSLLENANPVDVQLREDRKRLEDKIKTDEDRVNTAADYMYKEQHGQGATGKVGDGPAAADLRVQLNRVESEYRQNRDGWRAEIDSINRKVSVLQNETKAAEDTIIKRSEDKLRLLREGWQLRRNDIQNGTAQARSILARNRALGALSQRADLKIMIGFITLLFVFLELSPILVKIFTRAGSYEEAIADLEYQASIESRQRQYLARQEYNLNRSLLDKMARSQKEVISDAVQQWRQDRRKEMQQKQPQN